MNLHIPVGGGVAARPGGEFDARTRDEVPSVIVRDILGRRRPEGHVIVFANEKGGVGKSTLAYQCALALSHRGFRVAAVDCDRRQGGLRLPERPARDRVAWHSAQQAPVLAQAVESYRRALRAAASVVVAAE